MEGNIYPFAYEPVTDAGSEMFQKQGFNFGVEVLELHLEYDAHLYNKETYETGVVCRPT